MQEKRSGFCLAVPILFVLIVGVMTCLALFAATVLTAENANLLSLLIVVAAIVVAVVFLYTAHRWLRGPGFDRILRKTFPGFYTPGSSEGWAKAQELSERGRWENIEYERKEREKEERRKRRED